ncbi:hypothetical protein JMA_44170 (plasmid) [Jeotgalibacillus malaysiensis]|uniref:Uncharacterized protein n=1 Tax=Jeotgalibacillus malaysiensis TaxID=1508404 RepID=A0A0B5B0R3_9BACL|nr:hypothetical protein JMA_44170 [Jeotgalibacillus malaysiensis]
MPKRFMINLSKGTPLKQREKTNKVLFKNQKQLTEEIGT